MLYSMRYLLAISGWLSSRTAPFIIAVAALTFVFPAMFEWVRGDVQTCILGFIMLTMGMTLTTTDFRVLSQRPLDIFIGVVAQYTIMPLVAFALVYIFQLPKGIAAGLILVGCSPGGVSSNIMSLLCKGDVAYSVGMTTASTLLAPLMTPLLVLWLVGESIEVDGMGLFRSILLVTLLPVGIGTFCNRMFSRSSSFHAVCSLMPGLAVLGLACIVGGVTSAHGTKFFESGLLIFLCIFLHNGLGYLLGYFSGVLTRMNKAKRRTLSIEVGMQNAGLATVLAGRHFPLLPEAAIAAAISCVWHSISGTLIAAIFSVADRVRNK